MKSEIHSLVTFGEIMYRLGPPNHQKFRQARSLDASFAGSEASVAASFAILGGTAKYITALPKHAIAEATLDSLRAVGIDTSQTLRTDEGRMGLLFLETGTNQRPSHVIYDREDTALAITPAEAYDWDTILTGSTWLHLSGITSAVSKVAAEANLAAAKKAQELGVKVSVDLNFRNSLWRWDGKDAPRALAAVTMHELMPYVSLMIGNDAQCRDVLGIDTGTPKSGDHLDSAHYHNACEKVSVLYPNVEKVVLTLRENLSASHNRWGAMLFDKALSYFSPLDENGNYRPYEIKNIVDRVGGGDSFAGALLFALTTPELSENQTALDFAVAASCLKHSIPTDINYSTRTEVEALMGGSASGHVIR